MSADIHRNTTLGGAPSQIERDSIVYNRYSRESRQFCITPITHRVIDSIATHKLLSKVKKLEVAKLLSKVKKLDPPPQSRHGAMFSRTEIDTFDPLWPCPQLICNVR
jgi:hypothetical protein